MNNDENIPKQKIIYETVYNLLFPSDDKILSEAIRIVFLVAFKLELLIH